MFKVLRRHRERIVVRIIGSSLFFGIFFALFRLSGQYYVVASRGDFQDDLVQKFQPLEVRPSRRAVVRGLFPHQLAVGVAQVLPSRFHDGFWKRRKYFLCICSVFRNSSRIQGVENLYVIVIGYVHPIKILFKFGHFRLYTDIFMSKWDYNEKLSVGFKMFGLAIGPLKFMCWD